ITTNNPDDGKSTSVNQVGRKARSVSTLKYYLELADLYILQVKFFAYTYKLLEIIKIFEKKLEIINYISDYLIDFIFSYDGYIKSEEMPSTMVCGWLEFSWGKDNEINGIKIDKNYTLEEIHLLINKKKNDIEWWYQKSVKLDHYSLILFNELKLMAQLLYHRYYTENSIEKATSSNNITADVSITCLFVATKIEETYKKLKDILIVAYYVLCPEGPEINTESQKLGGDKSLAFKSYQIVNECYKTTVCLRFPPHTLAVASIYLAIKLLQLNDFPPTPSSINSNDTTCEYEWYELFLCRIEDIEAINRKNRNEDDKNDHSLVIIDKEDVQMTSTSSIPTTNGTDKNNATTRYLFTPTYAIKPIIHY
ncbi:8193_t:CDS:10, partial [Entrophospora sp. SA101]